MNRPAVPRLAHRGTGLGVWLVRHAEVAEEWQGKAYGDIDVALSPAGLERTAELAADLAQLPPARIMSSPLVRARQLGEATAAASGLQLELEPALAEIHRGRWQGLPVAELDPDEIRAFYADPFTWNGHGGENDADVARRAGPVVERLLERPHEGPSREVVVVAHSNVIRVLLALALEVPSERSFALRVDLASAALLIDAPRGWTLAATNVHSPTRIAPSLRPR